RMERRLDALVWLSTNTEFGLLDAPLALTAVEKARLEPRNQDPSFQTQAELVIRHLEERYHLALQKVCGSDAGAGSSRTLKLLTRFADWIESMLDASDAKLRRKLSNRLQDDLVHMRISHDRVAAELRDVMKRQKGGWLRKAIQKRVRLLRESLGLPAVG
ncbi:MAG: hypothetical protein ACYTFT_14690, partial [Planctomycetota bacterium]